MPMRFLLTLPLRALASVWPSVAVGAILVAYLAFASLAPQKTASAIGADPAALMRHPIALACGAWLLAAVIASTIARVPFSARAIGAWAAHAGFVVLAVGAAVNVLAGQRGQAVSYRTDQGWSEINEFQLANSAALHVVAASGAQDLAAMELLLDINPITAGGVQLGETQTAGGVAVEVVDFVPRAQIVQQWRDDSPLPMPAAAVGIDDGESSMRNVMCGWGKPAVTWEFHDVVVMFHGSADSETAGRMLTRHPPEEICRGRDMLVLLSGQDVPLSLVILRADGQAELVPMSPGRAVMVKLAARTLNITVDRLFTHAALHTAAVPSQDDLGVPAINVRVTWGDWRGAAALPFDPLGQFEQQAWLCGQQRALAMRFGRRVVKLPHRLRIEKAEYLPSSDGKTAKDYRCDVVVDGAPAVIGLNRPLRAGDWQFTQGHWLDDADDPRMIMFEVSSRRGLPTIWTGLGLIAAGMFWAFFIKPLLGGKREGEQ